MLLPHPQTVIDPVDYLHVAKCVARKFCHRGERIEDTEIYAVCCEELVKIAPEYQGDDFGRYAYSVLKNAAIDYLKHNARKKRSCKLQELTDDFCSKETATRIPIAFLETFLSDHPEDTLQDKKDKELLVDFYLNQVKIRSLCSKLKVSRTIVYSRIKRMISKLKSRHSDLIENFIEIGEPV